MKNSPQPLPHPNIREHPYDKGLLLHFFQKDFIILELTDLFRIISHHCDFVFGYSIFSSMDLHIE